MKRLKNQFRLVWVTLGVVSALTSPIVAQTTDRDIAVAAKAINFLETALSGSTPAYVVFDPANAASAGDADAIVSAISASPKAGKTTLAPQKVEIGNLGSVTSPGVIFVAQGMAAQHAQIHSAAAQKKLLSVSADLDCVRAGQCVIGVASQPKVEIFINNSASQDTGISFRSAFLMMVKTL